MADAQALDALTLPLWGSRLIEASAGTGKTWTIAALYLRLVLGHGGTGALDPLRPDQILVMTFTRAATRELSDRIRARLVEAAAVFRGQRAPAADDTFLQGLLADHAEPALRSAAAHRLAQAADAMDEAAVHTIDAWCQRMLREHAFDSASLFDEELAPEEAELLAEACRDHWRREVYPLPPAAQAQVQALWADVGAMQAQLRGLLPLLDPWQQAEPQAEDHLSLAELLTLQPQRQAARLAELQALWVPRIDALQAWLDTLYTSKTKCHDGRKLQDRYTTPWLTGLRDWLRDPGRVEEPVSKSGRHRLTSAGMAESLTASPPEPMPDFLGETPALFDEIAAWRGQLARAALRHAAVGVAGLMAARKRADHRVGFDDLLTRLDRALAAGARGERLRARILAQCPVALIDEFQDTSPQQYRVFDRLYQVAANAPGRALLLIGDPKQSIYAFRGADIHSYLQARRATAGRHDLLTTNHRSTQALVQAVNTLFRQAEARTEGPGAFRFRRLDDDGQPTNPLPFVDVQARGRPEQLVSGPDQATRPALQLVVDANPGKAALQRRRLADLCAAHIVGLLNDERAGFLVPAAPPLAAGDRPAPTASAVDATATSGPATASATRFTRLRPADIAVLVRSRREAAAVRRALAQRRVASVYLSDRESVFSSREAADLLRWLRAVADPLDAATVRAALATATLDLDLAALARLREDDRAFEAQVELLRRLQGVWQRQGVLPMLRRSLQAHALPRRWLARPDGERRITNLLHLAELLQAASARLEGPAALIRWLAERIADPLGGAGEGGTGTSADEQIVRLESDADLVKVVTVHKSKGLEYPLVCLPYAASFRAASSGREAFLPVRGASGLRVPDFGRSAATKEAAEEERLQEDLRLLYVALTRARHALWLGVAPSKPRGKGDTTDLADSALGALLVPPGDTIRLGEIVDRLQQAFADAPAGAVQIEALVDPAAPTTPLQAREAAPALAPARRVTQDFARDWAIGSFSGLVRGLHEGAGFGTGAPGAPGAADAEDQGSAGAATTHASAPRDLLPDAGVQEELLSDMAGAAEATTRLRVPADDEAVDKAIGEAVDEAREVASQATAPGAMEAASGFTADGAHHRPTAAAAASPPATTPSANPRRSEAPWHHFPRGALAGNFVHEQLEWLSVRGFALGADRPGLTAELCRRAARAGWGEHAETLVDWLQAVVATELPVLGLPLAALQRPLPELEFWIASQGLAAQAIDALCRRHILPGVERPALPERQLRGMLMGFADLVFEAGGRYWVMDYKTNDLSLPLRQRLAAGRHAAAPGDARLDACYDERALAAAMAEHRYDVQAALYQLALHRLLRQRLGTAYRPERDLGGALYLFLRGIRGPARGVVHVPPDLALLDGLDALFGQPAGVDEAMAPGGL